MKDIANIYLEPLPANQAVGKVCALSALCALSPGIRRLGVFHFRPQGCFARLARFAEQDDEEIESVTGGTDEVTESGQELQEDGSGISFGARGKAADDKTGIEGDAG